MEDEGINKRYLITCRINQKVNRKTIDNIRDAFILPGALYGMHVEGFSMNGVSYNLFDFGTYYGSLEISANDKGDMFFYVKNCMKIIDKDIFKEHFSSYRDFIEKYNGNNIEYINQLSIIAYNSGSWANDHVKTLFKNNNITVTNEWPIVTFIDNAKKKYFSIDFTGIENTSGLTRYTFITNKICNAKIVSFFPKYWY